MKLAERMNRIGVESAFDVLVRARALEAQGTEHHSPGDRRARFPTRRATSSRRRRQALDRGLDALRSDAGPARAARSDRRICRGRADIQVGPEHVSVVPGGKPIIFFPMLALLEPGDEVIYPNPGFPIYESMISFLGATAVPMPLIEERGFSFDLDLFRRSLSAPHQNGDPELAAESDRRRDPGRGYRAIAEMVRERDMMVLSRRDLLADLL